MIRSTLLGTIVAGLAALTLFPAGGQAAGNRPCTASDLQGARAPASLRDHGLDTQDGPLIAGTRYRVVVVQELAIGDDARPVDGSITIAAPDGPALSPADEDGRPAYDFTPPGQGTLRLVVSWDEEVGSLGSGDMCSATQAFDLPVLAPTKATVTSSFSAGGSGLDSSFLLRLHGKKPQDPGKVTVVLRARRGTVTPPPPRGSALARFVYKPSGSGSFTSGGGMKALKRTFSASNDGHGVRIYPYPNIAFGTTLRFAFSLEVTQDGERIGGLRSGARCRRIQFAHRSAVKCHPVHLQRRP